MIYTTEEGGWNQSAIMTRGHEIARSLDENRDYRDRLSEGLTQAWVEEETQDDTTEADKTVQTAASDWSSTEPEEEQEAEKQVNIRMHVMENNAPGGLDKVAMTTEDALERLQRIPGVRAVYHDDGSWTVKSSWRGQELVRRRVDTFQEAIDTVIHDVAPAATRSTMLDDIAEEKGEWWVKTELNLAKMQAMTGQ